MSEKRVPVWPFAGLLVLTVVGFVVWPLLAQSVDEQKGKNETKDAGKTKDKSGVPDRTPAELIKYMRGVNETLKDEPPEEKAEFVKLLKSVETAAGKLLSQKEAKPAQRFEAVQFRWVMLKSLVASGEKSYTAELKKFLKRYAKDKNKDISEFTNGQSFIFDAERIHALDNKKREQLVTNVISFVNGGKIQDRFGYLMAVGMRLEPSHGELAARVYLAGSKRLAKSKDERISGQAKMLDGMARRSVLVGKTFDLKGTTVGGKKFQWSDYKGKVVLIDFWATWCRPCLASIPALKRYHTLYKSKGFEVVGVSVDDDLEKVKTVVGRMEIPWTSLFSRDPKAAGQNHPMATYYGVDKYPTTILVDQKGKVVEMDVHGERLERLLHKLLDKPRKKSENPKSEKPKPGKSKTDKPKSDK